MSDDESLKGKVVLSKTAIAIYVVVSIALIVAVGLMAGLIGKNTTVNDVVELPTASTTDQPPLLTTTAGNSVPEGPWTDIRLSGSLSPYHYVVDLQPDLTPDDSGLYWFNGSSSVDFSVMEATNTIVIHSNKLNYTDTKVQTSNGVQLSVARYWLYEVNQFLIVELNDVLSVGQNYTLSTTFYGELANDLTGLYRSEYTNADGEKVWIAITQMQSTDARKAFPCFDEPAMKATFDIYLWYKEPYFALSNMPVKTTEVFGDWKRATFERTLRMSTYLLAFMVSDFSYTESMTSTLPSVQTRIYARPQQVSGGNVDYARNITPTILDYYTGYFGVSYPLPKSDQAAVPDFALGGMENWGLVMYRETALLFNPNINSASNKQRVAAVIAHELSHQWFGNLITPLWWDELWLNEGFASFIEFLGMNEVEPTWRTMDQYVVIDLHTAMGVDGLTTSRPIVAENVNTPAEISALFDDITYEKAGCIIRMINQFTEETAFRTGLENYLKEHQYGSVEHNQLFEFWEAAVEATPGVSNPPGGFVNAMNTWVLQMGYPTINVRRHSTNPAKVVVTQERFLIDPQADPLLPQSPYNYHWTVPFWYKRENEVNKSLVWMVPDKGIELDLAADEFIIGNYEVFGYYRVNYDTDIWNKITKKLNSDFLNINVKSRAQIIDDAFNLAQTGKLDYSTALELTKFLRNDFDYVPWESALDVMSYFDLILGRSKVYGVYSTYLLYLVQPLYENLTWTDEGSHLEQYQRINAIEVACTHGNADCLTEANSQFQGWKNNSMTNNIAPNLRSTVYCQALANGGMDEWDFIWTMYQNETDSQEKSKLQYALTCTRVPWIIQRFLQRTLNESYVRTQDISSILSNFCYNEYARDLTWDFLRQEWDYIYNIFGTGFFSFSGIISSCTSHFSTEFELNELEDFKMENSDKLGSGLRATEQAIEKTKTNIQWRMDNEDIVYNWLADTVSSISL